MRVTPYFTPGLHGLHSLQSAFWGDRSLKGNHFTVQCLSMLTFASIPFSHMKCYLCKINKLKVRPLYLCILSIFYFASVWYMYLSKGMECGETGIVAGFIFMINWNLTFQSCWNLTYIVFLAFTFLCTLSIIILHQFCKNF